MRTISKELQNELDAIDGKGKATENNIQSLPKRHQKKNSKIKSKVIYITDKEKKEKTVNPYLDNEYTRLLTEQGKANRIATKQPSLREYLFVFFEAVGGEAQEDGPHRPDISDGADNK